MTWYEQLPKVELHVHLEGAIPYAALFELIQKYGGDPSISNISALEKRFKYEGFAQFIEVWSWKNQFLREYEDFSFIAELIARDMANQNIRYAELFFSPSAFISKGLEVQKLTSAIRMGLSRVPEIEIFLIADLVRDYGAENEIVTLEKLNEVKNLGVIGIGLGGSEHKFPPEPFELLFQKARQMGFHTNAHAGEAAGTDSIWDTIKKLHVDRIGHGTCAHEDSKLLDYIAEHRIPIELCPISNVRTGAVTSLSGHPIRMYFDHGLLISVNTDDPKMFGTVLAEEYRLLQKDCGFSSYEICKLILLGIESSWMPDDRKRLLTDSFMKESSWVIE